MSAHVKHTCDKMNDDMKKLLTVFCLATILLVGGVAQAQSPQAASVPWITPSSGPFLYGLKLKLEDAKEWLIRKAYGPEGEMDYLLKRANERGAEQRKIYDDYFKRLDER